MRWTEQQAAALRTAAAMRVNAPLDWENLAEEVESRGRSQRRELGSRIRVIIEHLRKLQVSAAPLPRRGWRATVIRERSEILTLLKQSPSLRNDIPELMEEELETARRVVGLELTRRREGPPGLQQIRYSREEVVSDWLPE